MGHQFLIAAFCATWAIQLGYVVWMVAKWRSQKAKLGSRP